MLLLLVYALALLLMTSYIVWGFRRAPKKANRRFDSMHRWLATAMIIVLMLQFFVGLAVNLWITLPSKHPGSNASDYFIGVSQGVNWALTGSGIILLVIHVAVAILLVALAISFVVISVVKRNRFWMVTNGLGVLFIQGAFFNGASFVNYNEQLSSLLMEVFFVLAISVYLIALYKSKPPAQVN